MQRAILVFLGAIGLAVFATFVTLLIDGIGSRIQSDEFKCDDVVTDVKLIYVAQKQFMLQQRLYSQTLNFITGEF